MNGLGLGSHLQLTAEEKMWEQFHKLWSKDVGTPNYDKKAWVELESRIFAVLKEAKNPSVAGGI